MITSQQIYWLAGLLEGEGCFDKIRAGHSIRISLGMTDKDTVEKANYLFGGSNVKEKKSPNLNKLGIKPLWVLYFTGSRAAGIMMSIYSLMSKRRQEKIKELLDNWKISAHKGKRMMYLLRRKDIMQDILINPVKTNCIKYKLELHSLYKLRMAFKLGLKSSFINYKHYVELEEEISEEEEE